MKRGEIYFANLSPAVGSEMDKRRPVLIVSNDANNHASNTVTILPITSNINRVYSFEVLLNPGCVRMKSVTHQSLNNGALRCANTPYVFVQSSNSSPI